MSVSVIAGLLIVWQVLAGYVRGAIRSLANLAGLVGAILLSRQVGDLLQMMFFNAWIPNPVWACGIAVSVAAFVIWIAFVIAGRILDRMFGGPAAGVWTFGLNKKLGLFIGFIEGVVIAFVFLWVVYFTGELWWMFLRMAPEPGRAGPPPQTFAAFVYNAKNDLAPNLSGQPTSWAGQAVTALDPTPQKFKDAVKLLGLLANQPETRRKITGYAGFARLDRDPAIHAALTDADLIKMANEGRPVLTLLLHSKVIAIMKDKAARRILAEFDWADALKFVGYRERKGG
ncbi:MAG: CvpA family protein [Verrucomicrobia bacterium]|nr:CvpA family protein [Verrucomicrobiota bacterium]